MSRRKTTIYLDADVLTATKMLATARERSESDVAEDALPDCPADPARVLVVPVRIALRRRIRERSWVIGCCTIPGLVDLGAWIAYLMWTPPNTTLACISNSLTTPGVPVVCEPIPVVIQAGLHHAAMLHLAWIVVGVAAGLWVVALVVSLILPPIRPSWKPLSMQTGRLST
jgi:hypothetical protein